MAKDDRFYLRTQVVCPPTNTFQQATLDLGSYVDALGKSILKIHKIAVQYSDASGATPDIQGAVGGAPAAAQFQLMTQSHNTLVTMNDKAVVSSGYLLANRDIALSGIPTYSSHDINVGPEDWDDGYLIGVDSMYIGGQASTNWDEPVYISMVLECSVQKLTQAAAMSLALSQQ